jgi:hypothetical protein
MGKQLVNFIFYGCDWSARSQDLDFQHDLSWSYFYVQWFEVICSFFVWLILVELLMMTV